MLSAQHEFDLVDCLSDKHTASRSRSLRRSPVRCLWHDHIRSQTQIWLLGESKTRGVLQFQGSNFPREDGCMTLAAAGCPRTTMDLLLDEQAVTPEGV